MNKFTELFLSGGGKTLAPLLATNFFTSRTWIAPQDGIIVVRAMGGGGGGALHASSATGGYSASWGAKALRVTKGTSVVVSIGAGGAGRYAPAGNGSAGGNTTVTINGVAYTAYGGPGGVAGAVAVLPDGPSPSANWDFGANSVRPYWGAGSFWSGGAGVDILAQGNNATTSSSGGGGGTGSPATPSGPGGAMANGYAADGRAPGNPAIFLDASDGEWGISFFGGSGGSGTGMGGNGGGGSGGSYVSDGGLGGGGGGSGSGSNTGGAGGLGGGGGGNALTGGAGGRGGAGFAHLKFYADMGI